MKKEISNGTPKISADKVKNLRELTGASVMECRNALENSKGDIEMAREYLRKIGKEKAQKKSGRETKEGLVSAYIHSNKKIGSLIEIRCETDFAAKNSEIQELAHDLAMHVAAMDPKYVSLDDVSPQEKKEYEILAKNELAGEKKPAAVIEKIISGKTAKHFSEQCLLSQKFIKNPDIVVEDLIKEKISKIGENIKIERIVRFEI
ncbi:MAG: Elongation factor Ts [Candidatus Moranbacteria bacterium GW2011_GWC1_45_18]|nr:MAG: Elongation factor Ts [Candidatus Moranbacteria bacterium GW2011_GWC2_40_12]KKT33362.1 MAG: Elongation factor Ts [Candidatus Moranbacteria bacterium GW2011_GWF2_44_10]KKT72459.1 MAG: Elongation factor Ts [Candidatus Moranbacteria bacterium GW2011_GWF1_44_4]KKT99939.1 MAG: Elongation factor Ts [Candidatus Moranbacteria bacterium GW2011_GWC1_45_18]OGI34600.1 MAG: elongation factor Ts [Candidatus Moranbacteria bacterium RIFOXYC1_FULL_44_8]OGI39263.1 MAG: elongation factor Ts [Candidatus Mo